MFPYTKSHFESHLPLKTVDSLMHGLLITVMPKSHEWPMFLRKRLHHWLLTPLLSMLAFSVVTSRARYPIASSSQTTTVRTFQREMPASMVTNTTSFVNCMPTQTLMFSWICIQWDLMCHLWLCPHSVFVSFFPNSTGASNVSKNHGSTLGSLQGRDIQLLGKPQHIFVRLATESQSWSLRFANAATGWC